MAENDKPASLLTNTQRDYLKEKEPVSSSYERNLRNNIQDRIEVSMGDFATLFHELNEDDVREAFGDNFAPRIGKDDDKFQQAVEDADSVSDIDRESYEEEISTPRSTAGLSPAVFAFLLRGLNYENEQIYEAFEEKGVPQPAFKYFFEKLEQGVEMYLHEQNYAANVTVDINLNDLTPDEELLKDG